MGHNLEGTIVEISKIVIVEIRANPTYMMG